MCFGLKLNRTHRLFKVLFLQDEALTRTRAGEKSWSANNEVWSRRPPVSWIIVWMWCNHEDSIGVELAYKTGALHYLYRQFAIAQCQWNCSVCRLQEILFPVEVGDKSLSLEVLLQKKNWFRYNIWLLNTKQNRVETRENKNCKTQFNFENKYPRLCQVQSLNMIG